MPGGRWDAVLQQLGTACGLRPGVAAAPDHAPLQQRCGEGTGCRESDHPRTAEAPAQV